MQSSSKIKKINKKREHQIISDDKLKLHQTAFCMIGFIRPANNVLLGLSFCCKQWIKSPRDHPACSCYLVDQLFGQILSHCDLTKKSKVWLYNQPTTFINAIRAICNETVTFDLFCISKSGIVSFMPSWKKCVTFWLKKSHKHRPTISQRGTNICHANKD